jgi:hypothetical protein
MTNAQAIKTDWVAQRCKPSVMPFAGIINKPDGKTASEFAQENFTYCVQSVAQEITAFALKPIEAIVDGLTALFGGMQGSINNMRIMLSNIRENVAIIAKEIMQRIFNVMIPLQTIFTSFRDLMAKTIGILTTGLYTVLSAYYILQSLLGTIVESIIKLLVVMLGIITALWMVPVSWPVAATTSAIFVAIAVPLAIIVAMMSKILHIQSSKIPKLKCFDENVLLKMNDGTTKPIKEIQLGDILENNNSVTAKMKLDTIGVRMYNLHDVIVSESHVVKHANKWLRTRDHPEATIIRDYYKPYLYCLNTSQKHITINGLTFTDWDEIYDETLQQILDTYIHNDCLGIDLNITKEENIHEYLDRGFSGITMIEMDGNKQKRINEIQVGDKLSDRNTVYGIVEIDASTIHKNYIYHLEGSSSFSQTICGGMNINYLIPNTDPQQKYQHIYSTLNISKTRAIEVRKNDKKYSPTIYHLLTSNGSFKIGEFVFLDYNYGIDSLYQ